MERSEAANASPATTSGRVTGLTAAGALLAAIVSASCCVVPFVLIGFGASGAWMSNLTLLAPWQPYIIALALVLLVAGFVLVWRRAGSPGSPGAWRRPRRRVLGTLLLAKALVVAAIGFPYYAPWFYG